MGPGQNFLTQVRSIFCCSGRVESAKMVWLWVWKISPKNPKFCNFIPFGSKKISSGSGQRQAGLLFTLGQKYAQIWSDQGPSLEHTLDAGAQ